MNAATLAKAAYARPETVLGSPRALEYELLARATAALAAATERDSLDFPALAEALDRNLRLWSRLAADVAGEGNQLPKDLRARLFYLYEFTAQHSRAILGGRASAAPLIAINTAVMRGLRGETGE
jgi:flagellar biosynthesis activator protein FlaF